MLRIPKLLLAVLALLAVAAAPASARSIRYRGKTRAGNTITFTRVGNKVKNVRSGVPVTCLSINRVGMSRSGVDYWLMPQAARIGRTNTVTGLMMTALYYSPVTLTAKTTLHLGRRGRITGKLEETFAYAIPTYPIPLTIDYGCRGVTTFSARPR
jgi:hypothetical protein